jgi:hypothetical protein
MLLEKSKAKRQIGLVGRFATERYVMSRLLEKLELHRYIIRRREGTDKIVREELSKKPHAPLGVG